MDFTVCSCRRTVAAFTYRLLLPRQEKRSSACSRPASHGQDLLSVISVLLDEKTKDKASNCVSGAVVRGVGPVLAAFGQRTCWTQWPISPSHRGGQRATNMGQNMTYVQLLDESKCILAAAFCFTRHAVREWTPSRNAGVPFNMALIHPTSFWLYLNHKHSIVSYGIQTSPGFVFKQSKQLNDTHLF